MRGTIPGLKSVPRIADMLPGVFQEADPTSFDDLNSAQFAGELDGFLHFEVGDHGGVSGGA